MCKWILCKYSNISGISIYMFVYMANVATSIQIIYGDRWKMIICMTDEITSPSHHHHHHIISSKLSSSKISSFKLLSLSVVFRISIVLGSSRILDLLIFRFMRYWTKKLVGVHDRWKCMTDEITHHLNIIIIIIII